MSPDFRLLDTAETARALGICKRSVQEHIAARTIGYIKIGRSVRFSAADLESFVDRNRVKAVGWKGATK